MTNTEYILTRKLVRITFKNKYLEIELLIYKDVCCWRLLDTYRQVWVSLLWGHCFFLLGPGARKVLLVPSKSLFPQICGSSIIKSHWLPKSNSLGTLNPFARSPGWEICCGS